MWIPCTELPRYWWGCHASLRMGGWPGGCGQVVGRGCAFHLVNTQHRTAPSIEDMVYHCYYYYYYYYYHCYYYYCCDYYYHYYYYYYYYYCYYYYYY